MMKKLSFLCLLSILFAGSAFASDYTSKYADTGSSSKGSSNAEVDELVDRDTVTLSRRLSDLQSRVDNLERENRFQNERMRRLDRAITDLKRRG